jgi:hypothetical protein
MFVFAYKRELHNAIKQKNCLYGRQFFTMKTIFFNNNKQ